MVCEQVITGASQPTILQSLHAYVGRLQIKADEKTKLFLDAYSAQRMKTDVR